MGAPGWPEFACCTASIAKVRMVLMLRVSSCLLVSNACSLATIESVSFERSDQSQASGDSASRATGSRDFPVSGSLPSFRKARADDQSGKARFSLHDCLSELKSLIVRMTRVGQRFKRG